MIAKEVVYKITSQVPKGKVTTYGKIAKLSGMNNPRVVGKLLHKNPNPKKIPCHRVVNNKGFVSVNYAFGGEKGQIQKLCSEGVEIVGGRVDLEKYLWCPTKLQLP